MMSMRLWIAILLLCSCPVSVVWSADIEVSPGNGTLAAAIAAANPGDTLLLRFGTYYGSTVTVNKSLTIRAYDRSGAVISGSGITIQGAGISVTLQGLHFEQTLVLTQAAEVKILENTFVSSSGGINVGSYQSGSLFIIGNNFMGGSISGVNVNDAYIAGNVISNGYIYSYKPVWIVGNDITYNGGFYSIYISSSAGVARVIGNRVKNTYSYYLNYPTIYVSSPEALISGNIVQLVPSTHSSVDSSIGISSVSGASATIINNVISGGTKRNTGISVSVSSAKVYGNIIENFQQAISVGGSTTLTDIGYNICFNNGTNNCDPANGNLVVDPKFIDRIDFHLAADSPAINAGHPDNTFADLDRSRNDIGAYGGPWSIGQYDLQRSADNRAPYVYPLFEARTSLNNGILQIRALGVARMR